VDLDEDVVVLELEGEVDVQLLHPARAPVLRHHRRLHLPNKIYSYRRLHLRYNYKPLCQPKFIVMFTFRCVQTLGAQTVSRRTDFLTFRGVQTL